MNEFHLCIGISDTYLGWHNFSIGAIDFDPSIEASLIVTLHNITSIGVLCPHPAVIRSLKIMTLKEDCEDKINMNLFPKNTHL